MPVLPTYPGVYIEEPSSGVRTIASVATSIAAFVDRFKQGPMNKATQIFGMADFNRIFGGLDKESEGSYAISQFFLNGGSEAWVVRVPTNNPAEDAEAEYRVSTGNNANQKTFLTLKAKSPGTWGNKLRVTILPSSKSGDDFDLTITHYADQDGTKPIASESFASLSAKKDQPRYCTKIVNEESKLVDVTVDSEETPPCTGTVIALAEPPAGLVSANFNQISVTIDGESRTIQVGPTPDGTLEALPNKLELAIKNSNTADQNKAWTDAKVTLNGGVLTITAGTVATINRVEGDGTLTSLGLNQDRSGTSITSSHLTLSEDAYKTLGGGTQFSITFGQDTKRVTLEWGEDDVKNLQDLAEKLQIAIRMAFKDTPYKEATVVRLGNPDRIVISPSPVTVTGRGGIANFASETLGFKTKEDGTCSSEDLSSNERSAKVPWLLTPAFSLTVDGKSLLLPLKDIAQSQNQKAALGAALQRAIRKLDDGSKAKYSQATVELRGNNLVIRAGNGVEELGLQFAKAQQEGTIPGNLKWAFSKISEGKQYFALAQPAASGNGNESQSQGADLSDSLLGDEAQKTGIYALRDADMFNLLCLPAVTKLEGAKPLAVLQAALNLCKERRAFLIVDVPDEVKSVQDAKDFRDKCSLSDKANAAVYFPQLRIPDPLDGYRPRSVGASGTMAGLYARTDVARGVWKAPAGTEATLAGVVELTTKLTDRENGALNPLGINCARSLPIYGHVCWGARTLDGADEAGSEWKYIPIRRLALFIEESLFRGTKWVVFEPNDEPLWAKVRLNVRAFMLSLFQQGAFQGTSEAKAFYVRCDATTTTQDDRNKGIINIEVGFAPLKPAEFVIIKVQQIAGDLG